MLKKNGSDGVGCFARFLFCFFFVPHFKGRLKWFCWINKVCERNSWVFFGKSQFWERFGFLNEREASIIGIMV